MVGAALLGKNGVVYTGCNIENAAYGASNCAERTAIFKAVEDGCRSFTAIAVAGGPAGPIRAQCPPCGICRQVMAEFCSPDFAIYLWDGTDAITRTTLGELLPGAFGSDVFRK